jgi:hypothetical protein
MLRLDELDATFSSGEPPSLLWYGILYIAGPILLAIILKIVIYIFGERLGFMGPAFEMFFSGLPVGGTTAVGGANAPLAEQNAAALGGSGNNNVNGLAGLVQQVAGFFSGNSAQAVATPVAASPAPPTPSTVLPTAEENLPQPTSPVRTRRYQSQFSVRPSAAA